MQLYIHTYVHIYIYIYIYICAADALEGTKGVPRNEGRK